MKESRRGVKQTPAPDEGRRNDMKLRMGICRQMHEMPAALTTDYDYLEPAVAAMMGMEDDAFRRARDLLLASPLRAESANCLLPGTAVLYGEKKDTEAVYESVKRAFSRLAEIGCHLVVFGSGRARRVPDGMTRAAAEACFTEVVAGVADLAVPYGIRVAIEPLRASETNYLHTLAEGAAVARLTGRDNVGVTADLYHMAASGEGMGALSAIGERLFHAHISNPSDRSFPAREKAADFAECRAFLLGLRAANYRGCLTVEAVKGDAATEAATSLRDLRAALAEIG